MDEYIRYVGGEVSNVDYHHGQLRLVVGAQRYQVLRGSLEHPELAEGFGWTITTRRTSFTGTAASIAITCPIL